MCISCSSGFCKFLCSSHKTTMSFINKKANPSLQPKTNFNTSRAKRFDPATNRRRISRRETDYYNTVFHAHTKFIRSSQNYPLLSVQALQDEQNRYTFLLQSKKSLSVIDQGEHRVLFTQADGMLSCRAVARPIAPGEELNYKTMVFATGTSTGMLQIQSGKLSFRRMRLPAEVTALDFMGPRNIVSCYKDVIQVHDFVKERSLWCTHDTVLETEYMANGAPTSRNGASRIQAPTQSLVSDLHTDRINRLLSMDSSDESNRVFVSASYDKQCFMWDTRLEHSDALVQKWSHESPIESITHGANEHQLITCGGNYFRVWDCRNLQQGPIVHKAAHQNTITDAFYDQSYGVLVTTSLDEHLNFYSCLNRDDSYPLMHTIKLDEPLIGVAFSPNRKEMLVASAGKDYFKSRSVERQVNLLQKKHTEFTSRQIDNLMSPLFAEQLLRMSSEHSKSEDNQTSYILHDYQPMLKAWKFKKALTRIMTKDANDPVKVVAFIEQMRAKRYTHEALSNRNDVELLPILIFCNKYLSNPKFLRPLLRFVEVIVEIYGRVIGLSPPVDEQFQLLRRRLNELLRQGDVAMRVMGSYETLMSMIEIYGGASAEEEMEATRKEKAAAQEAALNQDEEEQVLAEENERRQDEERVEASDDESSGSDSSGSDSSDDDDESMSDE